MSQIQNLPGAGSNFRANIGPGSFSRKLRSATVAGDLKNLGDNRKTIDKVVKKYELAIKRGNFNRLRQLSAYREIKKIEGAKLSKDDARDIKKVFKYLGGDNAGKKEAPKSKVTMDKALDKDLSYSEKRLAERKARASIQFARLNRQRTGGETTLKFSSQPQATDRPAEYDNQQATISERLLRRRLFSKEDKVKARLPRYFADYEKEKAGRFEVSQLEKKKNKNDSSRESGDSRQSDNFKHPQQDDKPASFQNL